MSHKLLDDSHNASTRSQIIVELKNICLKAHASDIISSSLLEFKTSTIENIQSRIRRKDSTGNNLYKWHLVINDHFVNHNRTMPIRLLDLAFGNNLNV